MKKKEASRKKRIPELIPKRERPPGGGGARDSLRALTLNTHGQLYFGVLSLATGTFRQHPANISPPMGREFTPAPAFAATQTLSMMAAKRDLASLTESEHDSTVPSQPSSKRARNTEGSAQKKSTNKQHKEPATDVTYGQRCCFPGLGETAAFSDEDLEPEDDTDALAYLQSVR